MNTKLTVEVNVPDHPQPGSAGMTLADLEKFVDQCKALNFGKYEVCPRFWTIGTTGEVWKIEATR